MFQKETMTVRLCVLALCGSYVFLSAQALRNSKDADSNKAAVPTLTVCEALTHASKYDGKIVRVRDRVAATDEGASFLGEDCPGIFTTDGKIWPSAIAWTMPSQSHFILHSVDFRFDWDSGKRVDKKWEQLRKHFPDRCIAVTYTGMFESWSPDKAKKTYANGMTVEIPGFGHLNGAPAQLILQSADDVSPIPNCKSKK
ncbi:MAG: hypothetical protein ACHP79_01320 [Terriglobales bacterium]